jgi:hypothetical protein
MVASGPLNIGRFEEGIAIFTRGCGLNVHVTQDTGHVNPHVSSVLQETDDDLRYASNESSQQTPSQQTPSQQTPSQVAQANATLAKMAYERTTRIAQEKTQEAAQEVERIAQEATAESRKAKKGECYRVMMEKLVKF